MDGRKKSRACARPGKHTDNEKDDAVVRVPLVPEPIRIPLERRTFPVHARHVPVAVTVTYVRNAVCVTAARLSAIRCIVSGI